MIHKSRKKSEAIAKKPNLKTNYIYRLLYDVLTVITPFITTPYVSRVLGADNIGIYSAVTAFITYFTLCAALGTMSYGTREISRQRDDAYQSSKTFLEIELMSILTSLICIVGWCLVIAFSKDYRYYYLASLPLLLSTMFDISWFFMGFEKVKYLVVRNSFCKLASIVLLFLLVKTREDLLIYILINSVVQLVGNLSMWTYLPKMLVRVDVKTLHLKRHFRETIVYFIPTVATSIYTVLDKSLIKLITNDDFQNGYYEQATKVINIVKNLVFTSVNAVLGARISYLFKNNQADEIKDKIRKSLDFIMFLGFAAVFGIIGVARNFVPLFFGEGYEQVIPLLYVMCPIVLIVGVSNCLGSQYYTPSGKRAQSTKYLIAGSIVNLFLNLLLIPFYGAIGATIGSIFAELSITILYVRNCDGFLTAPTIFSISWKKLIAGICMCCVVYLLGTLHNLNQILVVALQVIGGGIVYIALLLAMRDGMMLLLLSIVKNKIYKIYK